MKTDYTNEALDAIHESAAGLHKFGFISDKRMHEYDENCLHSEDASSQDTKGSAAHTRVRNPVPVYASPGAQR
jgi:DNA-binding transcriptional regulator YiaG